MILEHFLITQFNLRNVPFSEKNADYTIWGDWTRERIDIFTKYCLPSIDKQTCKDFTWLIYFDKQTPEEFNWLIDELNTRDFIKVRFSKGNDGFMVDHIRDIQELAQNSEWIISSRIDNDDIFHKDAIKVIQEAFRPIDEYMISLTSGYTLNLQTLQMGHYYYPESPFISIIEHREKVNLKSIYYKSHSHWDELKFSVFKELFGKNSQSAFIINQPYWIQLVHGKNVSNSEKRGFPVITNKDLSAFQLSIKNNKYSLWSIPSFYSYPRWKRYFKILTIKLIRNILHTFSQKS